MAILWFAPQRYGTINTPRGEDAWLQVGALVLAIAIGDPKGHLGLLGLLQGQISPLYRDRGRIQVDVALVEVKDLIGPYRTGREHLHRARVIEPIEDPPHTVISKGARRDRLA